MDPLVSTWAARIRDVEAHGELELGALLVALELERTRVAAPPSLKIRIGARAGVGRPRLTVQARPLAGSSRRRRSRRRRSSRWQSSRR